MTDANLPKLWEPQPDEPPEWYNRFHIYLTLGQTRTLTAAYREWSGSKGNPSGTARQQAAKWNWKERALAYDQANREEKAAFETARETEARERRLRRMEKIIDDVTVALDTADLRNLSTEQARDMLPSLRLLYASTSELQRRELQSGHTPDQLPADDGWPVLDAVAEKILDTYYSDEELASGELASND